MKPAHTLEAVVAAGYAPSVRWLQENIRRGKVRAFRVARSGQGGPHWDYRMTDEHLDHFVESRTVNPATHTVEPEPEPVAAPVLTLTPRSARYHRATS